MADPPDLIITTPRGLTETIWPVKDFINSSIIIKKDSNYNFNSLEERFFNLGYIREEIVEDMACFSIRGEIIDIYSPLYDQPIRIEFFNDTVESIRFFDPNNQRSCATINEAWIIPTREVLLDASNRIYNKNLDTKISNQHFFDGIENERALLHGLDTILPDYISEENLLFLDNPERLKYEHITFFKECETLFQRHREVWQNSPPEKLIKDWQKTLERFKPENRVEYYEFKNISETFELKTKTLILTKVTLQNYEKTFFIFRKMILT
jgi:Transcription-repair coupling factor (superfamily II helicase)